jgi:hypothetical protein
MSIFLVDSRTGIRTSTELSGVALDLYLRENPDIKKVGIGTTTNQPYYILLNETTEEFRLPYVNNGLSYNPSTGTLSAGVFSGNGSGLTNVTATGSGIEIKDDNVLVGTARTVNFGNNLSVTFSSGISTISGASSVSAATTAYGLAGTPNLSVGIVTATGAIVGSAVTINSSGINVTGIITATSFSGNGANLTGIDATRIVNGNSNITVNGDNTITTTAPAGALTIGADQDGSGTIAIGSSVSNTTVNGTLKSNTLT